MEKEKESWRKRPDNPREPSRIFLDKWRVQRTGATEVECQCGRVHFATDIGWQDFAEEEKEYVASLLECSYKEPEKYKPHYAERVDVEEFDGRVFVLDCQCNGMQAYQAFIDKYEEAILRYLKKKAESELEAAAAAAGRVWQAEEARNRLARTGGA